MIYYDYYADIPAETIDAFVQGADMGRLVTVDADGMPHMGLYPFVQQPAAIEMHVNRNDEQFADLKARPRCLFEVDDVLAAQQARLMARYQPQGGFKPIAADHPLYAGAIAHIAALRLDIRNRRVKFKLGQNRSPEVRAKIVDELRKRGRPNDARAADALQWTIDRETGTA